MDILKSCIPLRLEFYHNYLQNSCLEGFLTQNFMRMTELTFGLRKSVDFFLFHLGAV